MPDRDPLQSLWCQQKEETFTMSMAEIHARATRFQSGIRTRNLTEYVAGLLVIGVFGWVAWLVPEPVVRLGAGLIIAGAVYVMWKLHVLAGASSRAEIDQAVSLADFHCRALQRQRDALATVWRWYLAPFVPGILVFVGGTSLVADTGLPLMARLTSFAFSAAMVAGLFTAIAWLNARAVKEIDAQIAELEQ
ncbi:hypothetical protein [Hyphomonas sp.]|uniref:hypothetical protein n=1 Tax=Hyphomonas sp. TaxID=87 RepID=UPI003D2B9FB3